jgi:hypothetical protein
MSKKTSGVIALAGVCALSLFLASCGSTSSRPSGALYVLTEGLTGIGNIVSAFAVDLDNGNLSMINSDDNASTCPTQSTDQNPEPCGIPLSIVLDSTRSVAFVLDQGLPSITPPSAPAIYPFKVNSDGNLSAITTPAASLPLGDTPITMTLDASGQFLFVLDAGQAPYPTNCPQRGSIAVPGVSYANCPAIWIFAAKPGSTTLTATAGSPFYISKVPTSFSPITITPPSGSEPCGTSSAQELLYVTSNQDLTAQNNDNALSLYCVDSSGNLTEQAGSPYKTNSDPVSVIAVNTIPAESPSNGGVFVYVGSQGAQAAALNVFQLCVAQNSLCTLQDVNNSSMVPVSSTTSAGLIPVAMLVDPTNNFLYVASQTTGQVFGFRISTAAGTLTALTPASAATGSQPVALAMRASTPDNPGQFLFVSNSTSSNITSFTVNINTGSMSNPITTISAPEPGAMVAASN